MMMSLEPLLTELVVVADEAEAMLVALERFVLLSARGHRLIKP
jgi:hypothetical protein